MDKYTKFFLATLLIVAVAIGGIWFYTNYGNANRKTTQVQQPSFPENPQKGDYGYKEEQTTVAIGTQGISKGSFVKVENGNIFVKVGTAQTQYPMTVDEVVLACTSQDLAAATELDYEQIARIKVTNAGEIGGLIPANQAIVVFAQDVEGTLRVHTVAMDVADCPAE
ncbi:hypothetical protein A2863_03670 [Candidatus Woesebacteria bacterium RIFCSPHIGHO2_01_FULL_38_9b]|uniref:Uncharacterized protein n=1 Tax=Candidatus Woesebacteria bacterium RIFCSPHIGHO2_01_FULL_38_9b TaxID=1802493 RepID=A0A1F7Y2T8_9BACT|nr:MAG: hypothetical protein A2863_03670 [Candidatus Woesebacteria bacterium RIFCSPHIGHO2_01_FULL_38_9b]